MILEEINISTNLGIINEDDVFDILKSKPKTLELIMTGRDAPQSYMDLADLVTKMDLRKHYFYDDLLAREGIDY